MLKYLEEIIDDNKEDNNANEVENTDKEENTNNNNIHNNNNNASVSGYPVKQFHLLINTYHYLNLIHIKYQPQMSY